MTLRDSLRSRHLRHMLASARAPEASELGAPAMVFAPHQDDETLGCGGTLARKTAAGSKVRAVFMTDGRFSHAPFIAPAELAARRRAEALDACRVLGVPRENVFFLNIEDGQLSWQMNTAVTYIVPLLRHHRPTQVYVPFRNEAPPDHVATYAAVAAALQACDWPITVFEYPVWYWHHWPWVRLPLNGRREARQIWRNTLSARLGRRMVQTFNCAVDIRGELARKQEALRQHRTQMLRPAASPQWPVLADVSDGDFLRCFMQDYEFFYCHQFTPASRGARELARKGVTL